MDLRKLMAIIRLRLTNYTEELAPVYYSDNSIFRIILYNLNYNVSIEENTERKDGANENNVGVNVGVKLNKTQQKIIGAIRENPNCTIEAMAKYSGVETRTIERNIKALKENGAIDRVGSDKTGYWIIKINQ